VKLANPAERVKLVKGGTLGKSGSGDVALLPSSPLSRE
jgi:hypothetical protein